MPLPFRVLFGVVLISSCSALSVAHAEDASGSTGGSEALTVAFGAGVEQQPNWQGSIQHKTQAIPYLDINWKDRIELSTTDGLSIDLIHLEPWHGGLVGTMMWGRSTKDLGALSSSVPTLNNTHQVGTYLEYNIGKIGNLGIRWRHDIQQTGAAYADFYGELGLPAPGPIEHSIKLNLTFMNESGMQRYFGVSEPTANSLNISQYRARQGLESSSLTYQAFLPISQSTGFVLGASWGVLAKNASDSPLVKNYGSKFQRNWMLAFTAHF